MAENSKIEWCHHTINLWEGCYEVHSGCDHCYAKTMSDRFNKPSLWGATGPRKRNLYPFDDLARYQRKAKKAGEIHRVFVGSMMDIFEKPMPLLNPVEGHFETTDDLRQELFTQITWGPNGEGLYPNLFFLFLTKRPSNIPKYVPAGWLDNPPPNVMYGTSISDQNNPLIEQLLKVKGKHFLSIEPLLNHVDIKKYLHESTCDEFGRCGYCDPIEGEALEQRIDWVIAGGESGNKARPMHPEWVRSLRDQCHTANVPFFFKQWGEWAPVFDKSGNYKMWRVGKKTSGSLLDGKQHLNFPKMSC